MFDLVLGPSIKNSFFRIGKVPLQRIFDQFLLNHVFIGSLNTFKHFPPTSPAKYCFCRRVSSRLQEVFLTRPRKDLQPPTKIVGKAENERLDYNKI